jgi:hypothetical protein
MLPTTAKSIDEDSFRSMVGRAIGVSLREYDFSRSLADLALDDLQVFCLMNVVGEFAGELPRALVASAESLRDFYEVASTRCANGTAEASPLVPLHSLRPVRPRDEPFLYELTCVRAGRSANWRRRPRPNVQTLSRLLWESVLDQQIITERASTVIGLVSLFDSDLSNGTTHVDVAAQGSMASWAQFFAPTRDFLSLAAQSWPLRKFYFEVDEHDMSRIASGRDRFFEVEAQLRGHRFRFGEYVDTFLCAYWHDVRH